MKTKHTEGPWKMIIDNTGVLINDASGFGICEVYSRGGAEGMANAHLIAAATDLLKALKDAAESVSSEYCSHGVTCSKDVPECYIKDYLEVIEKAEVEL